MSDGLSVLSSQLSTINGNVIQVREGLFEVSHQVQTVSAQHEETKDRLEELIAAFAEYVERDALHKELAISETRLIKVRQELEQTFGYYADIRRHAVGILQATDAALVRQETMHSATEEMMLKAPRYWLAPVLVALTAWISDNRPLADRALQEGLRRDDPKTTLFFALVCRRARKGEALNRWISRYFQIQNPHALDREAVVMLDAVANGVFGGAARLASQRVMEGWLEELAQEAKFVQEQHRRWVGALEGKTPHIPGHFYPHLRKWSPTWPHLEAALAKAARNGTVRTYFEQMFAGEIAIPPQLQVAVDALLDSLVKNFDDEELPLRMEERKLQLIVDAEGDKRAAEKAISRETEAFEEKVSFAGLLTNAAMNPELVKASQANQRYAVALSRPWILEAHRDMVARDRATVPPQITLGFGQWSGTTESGTNEPELLTSLRAHYAALLEKAMEASGISTGTWAGTGACAFLAVLFALGEVWFPAVVLILASGFIFWLGWKKAGERREAERERLETEGVEAERLLRACMVEAVEFRREWTARDAECTTVVQFLESLSAGQFVLNRPEDARAILTT